MNSDFTFFRYKSLLFIVGILVFSGTLFAQTKHIVQVSNNVFTPDELKINVGDTVEWVNVQGYHNVNGSQTVFPENPEPFGNQPAQDWTYSHIFNNEGKYDYQCDPHVDLGMTGKIEVEAKDDTKKILTLSFTGMTPHVGQNIWIGIKRKDTGEIIEQKTETVSAEFSVQMSGLELDHSYHIDFYADHNGNGIYDAPPTDHAWRLILNNVLGDTTLMFTHNTSFTDINLTTDVNDNFFRSGSLSVYPNPATNKIYLSHKQVGSSNYNIAIYNIAGIQLRNFTYKNSLSHLEIDIAEFNNGFYFIKVDSKAGTNVLRFSKQ